MKRFLFAAAVTLSAAGLMPLSASAQVDFNLVIQTPPPAPVYEAAPPPRAGFVWAPGFWGWDGRQYVWHQGHWEPARSGYRYHPHQWVPYNGGWRLVEGGWQPAYGAAPGVITVAPPPPRYEPVPAPRPGYFWAPGYWDWNGNRYVWVGGAYKRERPGYHYRPPVWEQREGHWVHRREEWESRGQHDRHDDDRHRPHDRGNHYGQYKQDRDHDGVPDRYDDHPDNPRRR